MPFLSPDHKPIIRHPSGHAVAVIAVFKPDGEFIPLYFQIEDDNQELFKYKIASVKSIKDKYMIKIFYCSYAAYGYRNEIVLVFDTIRHMWVLE